MASRALAEAEVESFISKVKQSDVDKKVDQIQLFGLKLENVDEISVTALDAITLTIAPLLKSTSQLLYNAVLTSLIPFYIPLLPSSPTTHIHLASSLLLPSLCEKLNDAKERTHGAARLCIRLIGKRSYEAEHESSLALSISGKGKEREGLIGFWERLVKETMSGKGSRAKIECMRLLAELRQGDQAVLPLRPWLAPLVDLLEDGDGNVRDQARETVVALVAPANTPAAAKSEIKKLLQSRNTRKTIADGIIARIFAPQSAVMEAGPDTTSSPNTVPTEIFTTGDFPDIVHVARGKDLEEEFARMSPYFEGKETEHNWGPREKSMLKIRGILRGKAFAQFPEAFINGLRTGILNGITRTLLSLRTTVAQQSCSLMHELVKELRGHFDPFVEHVLPTLGKMAGFTKKIIAEKSQICVTAIITYSTCHPRLLMAHISEGIVDKNIQTRQYSTSHLREFSIAQGSRCRATIESSPTIMDALESGIRRSLLDINPLVRERARLAFWSFHDIWPTRAVNIMGERDASARKQLEKVNSSDMDSGSNPPPEPATKNPVVRSAMATLLAEKRKAKAAEMASARGLNGCRTVSTPAPNSPSLEQRGRATSSTLPRPSAPLNNAVLDKVDKEGSSPPSPSRADSLPRTPTRIREELVPFEMTAATGSIGSDIMLQNAKQSQPLGEPDLQARAEEAELTARSLLDVDTDRVTMASPITPGRNASARGSAAGTPASYLLKTPMNGRGALETPTRAVWDDSPRPEAMTPLLLAQLRERKHERTWWLKRQELMDKASPLRSRRPDGASAVSSDVQQLENGQPSLRNLQKLALFSETHPILDTPEGLALADATWHGEGLFDRIFVGLTVYLQPNRPIDLLEQALVLLWEMVRNQWAMFKDREDTLVDSLFRLRACTSIVIHESVNSLMSLLCEVSDAVFLLSVIHFALTRYLDSHASDDASGVLQTRNHDVQASGFLFGLTALGRCILRIPPAVLRIEVPRLAPLVSEALSQESTGPRKAAHTLILAVQAVINDAQETMNLLDLTEGQRDFAFYMLAKNKLWTPASIEGGETNGRDYGDGIASTKAERVKEEMDGLLGRGN